MINKIIASFSIVLAISSTALPAAYPLHEAARACNIEQLHALLAGNDIDINAQDDHGMTPLHCAAINGNLTIVQEFLKNHATININAKNGNNWTPLHCAAWWGHFAIVEELLKAGADFEAKTINDKTPKEIALGKGHSNIVALLQNYENFLEIKEPEETQPN